MRTSTCFRLIAMLIRRPIILLELVLIGSIVPGMMCADELPAYTYAYMGNPFNTFVGGLACPPDCSISGTFMVTTPLLPSTSTEISPLAFDFYISTVGASWTSSNGAVIVPNNFLITTDASDNIISWDIILDSSGGNGAIVLCGPPEVDNIFGCGIAGGPFGDHWRVGGPDLVYASSNAPGSWSLRTYTTPEGSTTISLLVLILALIACCEMAAIYGGTATRRVAFSGMSSAILRTSDMTDHHITAKWC